MTIQMNIALAKARLSELVALAEAGEEVIISRAGKAAVRLIPTTGPSRSGPRPLGFWSHLGSLVDPDIFLREDHALETIVRSPIEPET